jgi:hypothetical protein
VAHREFTDALGVRWQAWAVIPGSADRRDRSDRRSDGRETDERRVRRELRIRMEAGFANGWLVFESDREKRRLHPIPEQWAKHSDEELRALLSAAVPASRTTRRLIE